MKTLLIVFGITIGLAILFVSGFVFYLARGFRYGFKRGFKPEDVRDVD